MIKDFCDNVKVEIISGIVDLESTLEFIQSDTHNSCVGFRIKENPYTGHNEKKIVVPTLEVLKYCSTGDNVSFQPFLVPLKPIELYQQVKGWLEENKDKAIGINYSGDGSCHLGFHLRMG